MTAATIFTSDPPIAAEIDTSEPGRPCVWLQSGCNEFWLDKEQAEAVIAYLQRVLPLLNGAPE